jgi:hypothetical protein
LVSEPSGHVDKQEFNDTVAAAEGVGFEILECPSIQRSRSVLLQRS